MTKKYYEVLWYDCEEGQEKNPSQYGISSWRRFNSKKKAMEYYEKHKDDKCKCLWWVTYRDEYGSVLDDLVY